MNEYLIFFLDDGLFDIDVNFVKSSARIAKRSASLSNIAKLLELIEFNEQPCMTFDGHQGAITEITIDPVLKKLKLTVQL